MIKKLFHHITLQKQELICWRMARYDMHGDFSFTGLAQHRGMSFSRAVRRKTNRVGRVSKLKNRNSYMIGRGGKERRKKKKLSRRIMFEGNNKKCKRKKAEEKKKERELRNAVNLEIVSGEASEGRLEATDTTPTTAGAAGVDGVGVDRG